MQITAHPNRFLHIQIGDEDAEIPRIFPDVHHFVALVRCFRLRFATDTTCLFCIYFRGRLLFFLLFAACSVFASDYLKVALLYVCFACLRVCVLRGVYCIVLLFARTAVYLLKFVVEFVIGVVV